jgi:hypothetical protein
MFRGYDYHTEKRINDYPNVMCQSHIKGNYDRTGMPLSRYVGDEECFAVFSSDANLHSGNVDVKSIAIITFHKSKWLTNKNHSDHLSNSEYASLVSISLGLSKSDIARIFGITRPTLYSWIKGENDPKCNEHLKRLHTLGDLTSKMCKKTKRPLFHGFVEKPMLNQEKSILELLLEKDWDIGLLKSLLNEARCLTEERDEKFDALKLGKLTKYQQDSNLLDNSISLGIE